VPSSFVKVATVAELADGTMIGVKAEDDEICLVRVSNRIYAINNVCSHFYTFLSDGWLQAESLTVQCPLHESCFDLKTGEPTEPPADQPVKVYSVKIENGEIFVGPER